CVCLSQSAPLLVLHSFPTRRSSDLEGWEYLGAILDDEGVSKGIVARDIKSMEIKSFPSDVTIMATGGPGIIFGKSTNSMINTGSAASILYQQGAKYA